MVNFTIDGQKVTAQKGETILNVARREGIYIPTMCYIEKTSPCASCRLCSVEVEGVDGFILSCNTPPTEGIAIKTNSAELEKERTNIMKLYDVNHPLECGVCDKSGECDLQNKTLEFGLATQNFTARDQKREIKDWGLINYDPALCILCEKCVHVCNENIGDDAIDLQFGGYKSTVIVKDGSENLDCTYCGECIAVCPVGALISSDFKYTTNAWELSSIPAICAHCSAGCSLEYDVKHASITQPQESIYRVKNNFEYTSLCGAGRFGFDFQVKASKDEVKFNEAVERIKEADAIRFSSNITNEEAFILNELKKHLGLKLFNEDARRYQEFMNAYSSVSKNLHHSGSLEAIEQSDAVIVIGSRIATDNPGVRYALTKTARHNGAKITYMHPIEDELMKNVVTQFIKYEVATEEGVLALLAQTLLKTEDMSESEKHFIDSLDEGYLSAESNVGDDELELLRKNLLRAKNRTLVVGSDLISHEKAVNIAKIVALIEKYSEFSVVVVPPQTNTLGVSLICDLDKDDKGLNLVGYNAKGAFTIGTDSNSDLMMPALNQQEGTFVSINNQLLPTNVAIGFDGYCLNDLANALGVQAKNTIDYTAKLPLTKGFNATAFDSLENYLDADGKDNRGYLLNSIIVESDDVEFDEVDELPEFNGAVVYHCNPVLQFNQDTARATQLEKDTALVGSASFASAAKLSDGDLVEITLDSMKIERKFVLSSELKGTIALNPTFDLGVDNLSGLYRFEKAKFMRVSS